MWRKATGSVAQPPNEGASMLRRNVAGSVERTAPGSGPAKTGAIRRRLFGGLDPEGRRSDGDPESAEGLRRRSLQTSRKQACAVAVAIG